MNSYNDFEDQVVNLVQKALHRSPKAVQAITDLCVSRDALVALRAFCVVNSQLPYLVTLGVQPPASAYIDQLPDDNDRDLLMVHISRALEAVLQDFCGGETPKLTKLSPSAPPSSLPPFTRHCITPPPPSPHTPAGSGATTMLNRNFDMQQMGGVYAAPTQALCYFQTHTISPHRRRLKPAATKRKSVETD